MYRPARTSEPLQSMECFILALMHHTFDRHLRCSKIKVTACFDRHNVPHLNFQKTQNAFFIVIDKVDYHLR